MRYVKKNIRQYRLNKINLFQLLFEILNQINNIYIHIYIILNT